MEEVRCTKEKEISELTTILKGIVKEFYGNGQKGIAREFPELRKSVETLVVTVAAQTKVISDLVEFQTAYNAVDDFKEKTELNSKQKTQIIITSIIGVVGLIIPVLLHILK